MITAVDSNVLLDVFTADAQFGRSSAAALERCLGEERSLVLCEVVWAEVAGTFPDAAAAEAAISALHARFDPLGEAAATGTGRAWRRYREEGGPRSRLIADFLIGAHAGDQADRLLTRDRGFFRRYFDTVELVVPVPGTPEAE